MPRATNPTFSKTTTSAGAAKKDSQLMVKKLATGQNDRIPKQQQVKQFAGVAATTFFLSISVESFYDEKSAFTSNLELT